VQYAIGLYTLGLKEMTRSTPKTGEKVSTFKTFGENDIVIGDRAYCSKHGIEYLVARNSDFLFRLGTERFLVYDEAGNAVDILECFEGLKPCQTGEKTLYYEYQGQYKPLRFCVLRKTQEAPQKGLVALRKRHKRRHGNKALSEAHLAYKR